MKKAFINAKNEGRALEATISSMLVNEGWTVMPITTDNTHGIGPRITNKHGSTAAMDILAWKGADVRFLECKAKATFSLHRNSGQWVTGLDKRLWDDYLKGQEGAPFKVALIFLQEPGEEGSPSGLYWAWLSHLATHVHHEFAGNEATPAMIYFSEQALTKSMSFAQWEREQEASK